MSELTSSCAVRMRGITVIYFGPDGSNSMRLYIPEDATVGYLKDEILRNLNPAWDLPRKDMIIEWSHREDYTLDDELRVPVPAKADELSLSFNRRE